MRNLAIVALFFLFTFSCTPFIPVIYDGDLIIQSDADLTQLQDFYNNGYNIIDGDLRIYHVGSLDLELLAELVEVDGDVDIFSAEVEDLGFLANLRYVETSLMIRGTQVTSLAALDKLSYVGGLLSIYNNEVLPEVKGFKNLTVANYLNISFNPLVSSVDGFNDLETCVEIHLRGDELVAISGFNALKKFSDLVVWGCPSELVMKGFTSLDTLTLFSVNDCANYSFEGSSRIKSCDLVSLSEVDTIVELKPFSSCSTTWLDVYMCGSLQNLDCVSGLTELQYAYIARNPALADFCGLQTESLLSIEAYENSYNPSLQDLLNGDCSEAK